MNKSYRTFEIAIATNNGLKFIEVVAFSLSSAHADIRECYGQDVEIVSSKVM